MAKRKYVVYEIVTCPQCKGKRTILEPFYFDNDTGRIQDKKVDCPKCGGTGNVYSPIDLAEALKDFMVDVYSSVTLGSELPEYWGKIVPKEPSENGE